jgi:hypothetical protein
MQTRWRPFSSVVTPLRVPCKQLPSLLRMLQLQLLSRRKWLQVRALHLALVYTAHQYH